MNQGDSLVWTSIWTFQTLWASFLCHRLPATPWLPLACGPLHSYEPTSSQGRNIRPEWLYLKFMTIGLDMGPQRCLPISLYFPLYLSYLLSHRSFAFIFSNLQHVFFFPLLILSGMLSFFYFTNFFFKATRKNFYMCSFFPITPCFLPPDLAVLPSSYLPPRLPVCSACSCGYVPVGAGPCTGAEAPASTMCPVLTCIIPLGTLLSIKK